VGRDSVGKSGLVIVTFWDKVQSGEAALEAIERLSIAIGVPLIPVNGRNLSSTQREQILQALDGSFSKFARAELSTRAGWRIEPKPGIMEDRFLGPCFAVAMLLFPALATILLFSVILAIYKTTGLIERINAALHPWSRHIGLSGRDLVRVVIGFGCNVPAVIGTRACSGCSRGNAMSAIAFGSACSYQLPATLAVLAAASKQLSLNFWILPMSFLAYLFITTVIYLPKQLFPLLWLQLGRMGSSCLREPMA